MTNEPSPRPWRVMRFIEEDEPDRIIDANGDEVAIELLEADAALIVDAVNNADSWRGAYIKARTERNAFLLERDRLRDIVRNAVETLEQVYKHADMTDALREVVVETQREARAAIGEEAK